MDAGFELPVAASEMLVEGYPTTNEEKRYTGGVILGIDGNPYIQTRPLALVVHALWHVEFRRV